MLLMLAMLIASRAATPVPTSIVGELDRQLVVAERHVVPAAEAMPAERYGFAPEQESSTGSVLSSIR